MKGYVGLALAAMSAVAAPAHATPYGTYNDWVFTSTALYPMIPGGNAYSPIYSRVQLFFPAAPTALARLCSSEVYVEPGQCVFDTNSARFQWTLLFTIGGKTKTYSQQTVWSWGSPFVGFSGFLNAAGTNIDTAQGFQISAFLPLTADPDDKRYTEVDVWHINPVTLFPFQGSPEMLNMQDSYGVWYPDLFEGPDGGKAEMYGNCNGCLNPGYYDPPVTIGPDGSIIESAPEASTWAMMGLGFAGLGFAGWRNRRAALAI